MTSTALRLLQQLVKKSESNLSRGDEDRAPTRRCWNDEARIHCARISVARNIRQAHMNPASSQKPASIKDFCNILFFVNALPLGLACRFFCARHALAAIGEPDSMAKIFFSQAPPGSACEGRFKFENERIAESLIRIGESPEVVLMPRWRAGEGLVRRFSCRATVRDAGAASSADENRHRDDPARASHR
jgi:hypothetical protein